ncbi:TadE/TadG family type IV pilus assembly protein [Tabrizicola sp.]|uniref:TadE/TadG family type IV pilus assembly protein n=1 Tax=Tabrizicola sp. TaxID=2005166 RepID=UPI0027376EE4|nr:TadE/TadG family type IV pilus assembly protein [Tabrizicola sp.]MDP3194978.1 TadE/TadG family type IV pilus assembly protein [Tabrizicola sp.]
MTVPTNGIARKLKAFLRQEGGSSTIEFVLWLPIVLAILLLIVDSSMLFMSRTHAIRVLQDTNRLYSVGQFTGTPAERITKAQAYALTRLQGLSPSATITTTETNRVVRTRATMETAEIAQIGFLGLMIDMTMVVAAEHRVEF